MVYCGKASQGCENCRIRRIKCDRVSPGCTQCIRARKPCPGYRDPISLMFRDESNKVIRKAHAQWGLTTPVRSRETSAPAQGPSAADADAESKSGAVVSAKNRLSTEGVGKSLPKEISATPVEKAIQFYLEHYVIGLPDEPKVGQELQGRRWIHSPETRDIMAAVGFSAQANLHNDRELNTLARQHYGSALHSISSRIQNITDIDLEVILRAVVMMATYEVVSNPYEPVGPARTHVMGGAAILSTVLSYRPSINGGARGLIQMCFTILAQVQRSLQHSSPQPTLAIPFTPKGILSDGKAFPKSIFEWIDLASRFVSSEDKPAAQLLPIVLRLVKLSARVHSQPLMDGDPQTANVIHEVLQLDDALAAWEDQVRTHNTNTNTNGNDSTTNTNIWTVTEDLLSNYAPSPTADPVPPQAVFDGAYHVYSDMFVARTWNHYRWARILTCQMLLEAAFRFPMTNTTSFPNALISPARIQSSLTVISRLARDILVSTPSHYRHPSLRPKHWACSIFDRTHGGAVIGFAGVPTLLFEIKVAGCAPGVEAKCREWALGLLETAWKDTGMGQARLLMEIVEGIVEGERRRSDMKNRMEGIIPNGQGNGNGMGTQRGMGFAMLAVR